MDAVVHLMGRLMEVVESCSMGWLRLNRGDQGCLSIATGNGLR